MYSIWIVAIIFTLIYQRHERSDRITKGFYSFFEPRFKVDMYRAEHKSLKYSPHLI